MTPQPAERTFLIWSGRKKTSVALLGTRSTVDPKAYIGLNLLTTWLGVASTVTVCAITSEPPIRTATTRREGTVSRDILIAQSLTGLLSCCGPRVIRQDTRRLLQRVRSVFML